ncbi:MAG: hypothetical protein JJU01_10170 [Alkalibacterium sp.]|nr:hypothetical protein [Alkalibacterium sp.]
MKKTLKALLNLTTFEFDRISRFLYVLIGITLTANLTGYILTPVRYVNRMNAHMVQNSVTDQQALQAFGELSFSDVISTVWILGPVALGISGLLLYSFFIWYREWFGKNTFAYRLLMLPVPRMHLFYSKLVVIYISIFTLIAVQIISLFIGFQLVSAIVPGEWLRSMTFLSALNMHPFFYYVLPLEPWFFIAINGIGIVFLLVLFTVILMERSFSVKGIMLGITYGIAALFTALLPAFLPEVVGNHYFFYNSELLILTILLLSFISFASIMISRFLLNRKITI